MYTCRLFGERRKNMGLFFLAEAVGVPLLVTIIIILCLILLKHASVTRRSQMCPRPPGPAGLPIIGNMHQFDTQNPHLYLWKLSRKYGPLMSLTLGSKPVLVVSSAMAAREVLKVHDLAFSNRPALFGGTKLSYNGLDMVFSPYSEYWREMRKISILHLFSLKRVQSFRPVREDEVTKTMQKISSKLSSEDQIINLSEMSKTFMGTFICRIAFGRMHGEDEEDERRRFDELLSEAQALLGGFFVADYFPSLGWIDKFTGMVSRLEKNFVKLDSFYQLLIDERLRDHRNMPKSMDEDILGLLIQLKEEQPFSFQLTWDHVKAMLTDIFIAGTDTGAAAVVWAMTALMKAPTAMHKVQTEIRKTVGKKKDMVVAEEDIQNLPYFKAVVKETFRMYPPAPLLVPRETTERCTVNGYEVDAGTMVYINAWAIARDPEHWENPHEFLPERFLDSEVDFRGQDFEFIPFGGGRRGCPGLSLGVATVELLLVNLLYLFDWEVPPGMKIEDIDTDVLPGLTMHKKTALSLVPKHFE